MTPAQERDYLVNLQTFPAPISRVRAIGVHLPDQVIDNATLVDLVEAPPKVRRKLEKMIVRITGIKTRRYAPPGTNPSDLACAAAARALADAGLVIGDIDTLIFSSTDMDTLEPSTANIVQKKLGIRVINAFDVTNACNSFLQAMNVANSMLATGAARRVLIVSGEIGSYVCNRRIDSLEELDFKMGGLTLGDAGAAMIMERAEANSRTGLLEINMMSLGEHWEACHVPETTDWRQRKEGSIHGWFYLDMPGLARIARRATVDYFTRYGEYRQQAYGEAHFMDSLAQLVPHQISRRFIEEIGKVVLPLAGSKADFSRVCITADIYGNTASTAIPVALGKLIQEQILALGSGQEVLLYGAASGFGLGHIRLRL